MPLVNATDIPLTPYPTGRTSPQAPSDYQNIPSSPAEFGSQFSEAQSGLGKTLEQVGTTLINRAVAQQHFLNLTEQDKLSAQLDDELHKQKYGDPTAGVDPATGQPLVPGFKNRYGSDAIDYIKSGEPAKAFNDTVARLAATASNDRVREMFMRQSRARRAAFDNSIDEHWTQQLAVQNKQISTARNAITDRDIAAEYDNDATVNSKINEKIANYTRGQTDPEVRAALYFNAVHDGAKQAIDAALAAENPTRAKQVYDAYKDNMTGDDQRKLWDEIKGPLNQQVTTGAGLRALGMGGGPAGGGGPGATNGAGGGAPRGGGAPLIPYTPASDILSGTGVTADQYKTFRSYLASREGDRYDLTPTPGHSRSGRYQFGSTEIAETAARLGVPVPTPQQFAGDPQLQERFLENYTLDHHNQLMESPAYRAAPPDARAGMLAGAHLMGVGGVLRYVNSGGRDDPADANGTRVSSYVRGMQQAMGHPAAPAVAPPVGAVSAPAGGTEIVAGGDSIGVGLNKSNKLGGTTAGDVKSPEAALSDAAGSRNPQQGLDYIKTHPERFAGKNVYWSTGLFNAGGPDKARAALPKVAEQLDALKEAGANAVVLVGLDKGRFAALNDELAKIAAAKGVAFGGPLPTSDIHPSAQGYRDYHAANAKLFPPSGGGAAAPAAPRPVGLVEPGNIGVPPT